MKRITNRLLITLILLSSFLPGEKKKPFWVENPPAGVYVGVSRILESEQEARNDAVKDAKRQIIANLGGLVETEFVDQLIETNETNFGYTDSKVKIIAKNILNVKTQDIYVKEIVEKSGFLKKATRYQAYAALAFSRAEHEKFMAELVHETVRASGKRFNEIEQLALNGQIAFALQELSTLPEAYTDVMNITGLSPAQSALLKDLDRKVNFLAGNIRNNLHVSSGKQKYYTKLNREIKTPLQIKVYWQNQGRHIPVKGAIVSFKVPENSISYTSLGTTNDQGLVNCKINNVLTSKRVDLTAIVAFPEKAGVDSLAYTFHLLPDNKISIRIIESVLDEKIADSYLENFLMQQFTARDFQVIENDFMQSLKDPELVNAGSFDRLSPQAAIDFIVFGNVTIDRTNKYTDAIHFAWARAVVKVFDVQKSEIIASIIHEEKGAGNSPKDAGIKAIQKAAENVSTQIAGKIENKGRSDL